MLHKGGTWLIIGAAFSLPCAAFGQKTSTAEQALPILNQRCASCHGAAQQMSGYDLRTREAALRGGTRGAAIVPGKADESALVLRLTGDLQPAMPLGGKLKDSEIAVIRQWINEGAKWTETGEASGPPAIRTGRRSITQEDRNWWAFRKPVRRDPPAVSDPRWSRNPIDAFVFAKLTEKGYQPAPRANKWTLIRRAYLDLTGLPPAPEEVDAFVRDDSPGAFAKLVDKLLASPHYGENLGRHWLDVARYADTGGYEQDFTYQNAWRYRDYVIRAFNQDKPYDRFVKEQLAGDELDDADHDALIATGFNRVGATVGFREKDNPQYRYIYLDDMIGTTTRAFLGLTVACARCHDHKFDPILQTDYYRLMAVFFPYINYDHPLAPSDQVAAYESQKREIDARIQPLQAKIRVVEEPYRKQAFEKKLATFPQEIQDAVHTPEERRTEGQKLLAAQVLSIKAQNFRSLMKEEDRSAVDRLALEIKTLQSRLPKPLPLAMGIRDGDYRLAPMGPGDEEAPGKGVKGDETDVNVSYFPVAGKPYHPPKTYLLEHGDYTSRGPEMQPGFVQVIEAAGTPTEIRPSDGRITTGRRRALAEWIASEDNPLTARVMVNRIWQYHFGRGLVATASNFGRLGTMPSHPELLDWLATEFVRSGWSVKYMNRLIMSSEAYQMASEYQSAKAVETDPDDAYLWHYPLRRMEGEAIHDAILAVSGNLNLQAGGPPYFLVVADQVLKSVSKGDWVVNREGPAVWRRGVYSYYKRGLKYPMFEVFDAPDENVTCEGRVVSTAPTQALTLLNNDFVVEQSKAFAERVLRVAGPEQQAQVRAAFRIGLSREPTPKESEDNVAFLNRRMTAQAKSESPALEALTDLCDIILNLNEFLYIN
jgi:hypothetical protein